MERRMFFLNYVIDIILMLLFLAIYRIIRLSLAVDCSWLSTKNDYFD